MLRTGWRSPHHALSVVTPGEWVVVFRGHEVEGVLQVTEVKSGLVTTSNGSMWYAATGRPVAHMPGRRITVFSKRFEERIKALQSLARIEALATHIQRKRKEKGYLPKISPALLRRAESALRAIADLCPHSRENMDRTLQYAADAVMEPTTLTTWLRSGEPTDR